ncbi:phosphatase PAP2 family protein [Primorskyibacter sp. 2E233]|uniref:bifunctional DedA family/phosphatase PAP2 family protein n=1 Tax=Primorskyibacter sp. 2E233 TaxID=3413431 RepID=UPI003BF1A3F9
MPGITLDQILPSIQSLGILGYWIIAAASMLEAFFLTGVVIPGTLIVDAGGILVQRGVLDYFDLVWFVAIGSILGSEASYWTGRLAKSTLSPGSRFMQSRAYARAQSLFARRGGIALALGRFSGPVAGLVPLVAALAGIERRTFVIWNIVGAIPFAFAHVSIGYLLGGALGHIGARATRLALLLGVLAIVLILVWWLLFRLFRLLPTAYSLARAALTAIAEWPVLARWLSAHPQVRQWLAHRFDADSFLGLPLTCLALVFVYVLGVWADVTLDFALSAPVFGIDQNVAQLAHLFWSPVILRIAAHVTALGDSRVIVALLGATVIWLLLARRWALMTGLMVAVLGNVLSVALLKAIFARPRPELAYFVETSGSFPSGHAAISIAFYGTLAYVLWRLGRLGQVTGFMSASILALAIGSSRVILIEHYLSDVLNGWLIGGLWLLVGVTVAEWRLHQRMGFGTDTVALSRGVAGVAGIGALVAFAIWQITGYDKALAVRSSLQADQLIAAPEGILSMPKYQPYAETLIGDRASPINLIVVAADQDAVAALMTQAGGTVTAAPTTLGRLADLASEAIRKKATPANLILPLFWSGMPDDLGVQFDTSGAAPLIARLWRTGFVTSSGGRVFVGSVTPDDRLAETAPTEDEVAKARDRLIALVRQTGLNGLEVAMSAGGDVGIMSVQ